ncbi:hypothetical protein SAMN05421799_11090 [Alicyclobacillus vulcanalis]|uniref:Uncharacterized protein n=2 Tax=Alicyclobacillaceae TaxID=186823 RepID=A0A1N7NZ38_9BACL|nr:hypothetical protein SAMN05421799_11090 [Alicyclobacillus vulcanalis]
MRVRHPSTGVRPHFDDEDDDLLLEMAEDLPGLSAEEPPQEGRPRADAANGEAASPGA